MMVAGKRSPHNSGHKPQKELRLSETEGCQSLRQFLFKGYTYTYSDSLPLSFSTGIEAQKTPRTYERNCIVWH